MRINGKEAITIPAFYILCVAGAAVGILLASPYYREIGDYVSGLFWDARDEINQSDDNEGGYQ